MFDSRRAPLILSGAAIVAIWFWFVRDGLASYFSGDDLMNLFLAWRRPLGRLAAENLLYYSPAYRPLGNLVYRLLFEAAGFHPLPFRFACFVLLSINLYLIYRTAAVIAPQEIGTLTALLACYNAGVDVSHDAGVIYDILCFTFYFLALALYAGARSRKQYLTTFQLVCFLVFYVCALDSKEMAVTLPAVLVVYELLFGEGRSFIRRWLPPALTVLMTVPYIFGKFSGSSPLINNGSYSLHITPSSYLAGLTHYLDLIVSLHPSQLNTRACFIVVLSSALLAVFTRDRRLMFALAFVLITPLPIVFVELRAGYVMYIPLFGIALFLAVAIVKLRDGLVGSIRKPTGSAVQMATFAICAVDLIGFHSSRPWRPYVNPVIRSTVQQLRQIQPRVSSDTRILFLDDPFNEDDTWNLLYICRLYYGMPELVVNRVRQMPTKPDQATIDSYDLIFTYQDSKLIRIKPPS